MARTVHITLASPTRIDFRQLGRSAWVYAQQAIQPDAALLTACAEFRRRHATLATTPHENEAATDRAWAARQSAADHVAALRPGTDRGRRDKARVALTLLQEVPAWQRESEVMFALAAFKAEAG